MELNEIIQKRIEKLNSLKQMGIDPYPNKFSRTYLIYKLLEEAKEGQEVIIAGRIMAKRQHGKASFADLRDFTGKIQIYVQLDSVGKEQFSLFKELDIGDFIGVKGQLFKTRTGEITVKVSEFIVLSKSLRPLPEKWHGLKDIQVRYRQRYLDLIANQSVKEVFLLRAKIITAIRKFLDKNGFIEVETPMLHALPGGAAGKPFKTFHNEYDMELYLRIAPELSLKRLLVGGFEKVYEINRSFRNEGISPRHNPEFTMLEIYSAYDNYKDMMVLTKEIIGYVAQEALGKTKFNFQGKEIDLSGQWPERSFAEAVKEKFNIFPEDDAETIIAKLNKKGKNIQDRLSRMQVVRLVEEFLQEDQTQVPVFFTDYFSILCPLAKTKKDNPQISERFELFIAGMEVANAYSELNDPQEQKKRFLEEIKEGETEKKLDEDYVLALEYGMPPAGGLGIGIDRLVMLFLDQPSIKDVILFPLLRPEKEE